MEFRHSKLHPILDFKRLLILLLLIAAGSGAVFLILCSLLSVILEPVPQENFPVSKPVSVVDIRFDHPSVLRGWKEYAFNGKSQYKIEPDPAGETVLHASSRDTYSSLYKVVNVPLEAKPVLSWEWRADKFPANKKHEKFDARGENDFAVRVCAIFGRNNPLMTEIIQYIWDDYFPAGTHAPSPYSKNVRMLVVRSGAPAAGGGWVSEKRDVVRDYEMLFGRRRYPNLRAVAVTTNSDDTHTEAGAYIKRIWIESDSAARIQKKTRRVRVNVREWWGKLKRVRVPDVFKKVRDAV